MMDNIMMDLGALQDGGRERGAPPRPLAFNSSSFRSPQS